MVNQNNLFSESSALDFLSESLESTSAEKEVNPLAGMSFKEFVFDVFALSFPEYDFDTWHIHHLTEVVQDCFDRGRNLCVVMPRYHLKSTLTGYASTLWRCSADMIRDPSCLYLSYKDGLAKYHTEEIKKVIDNNPILTKVLKNDSPKAIAASRFTVAGGGRARVQTGGIFSFKRGIHVNGLVVADDILRDPQTPLSMGQLLSVEQHINSEIANIPNVGVPLFVLGTPMHMSDILLKLKDNPEYEYVYLPALGPTEKKQYQVLWPDQYSKEWLDARSAQTGWKSFQTEFLLTPALEVEAFFTPQEISMLTDTELKNHSPSVPREIGEGEVDVFAGFDVGKKRHPSHLAVFARVMVDDEWKLVQIHQQFLDNVDYVDQVEYLTEAIENLKITKCYIDNTRAELEERGLPPEVNMVTLTPKVRKEAAAIFDSVVTNRNISFLDDSRFRSQIISVDNSLRAPETSLGHGESFWSCLLALYAHHESWGYEGGIEIGSMGDLVGGQSSYPLINARNIKYNSKCSSCKSDVIVYSNDDGFVPIVQEATKFKCVDCGAVTFINGAAVEEESGEVEDKRPEMFKLAQSSLEQSMFGGNQFGNTGLF